MSLDSPFLFVHDSSPAVCPRCGDGRLLAQSWDQWFGHLQVAPERPARPERPGRPREVREFYAFRRSCYNCGLAYAGMRDNKRDGTEYAFRCQKCESYVPHVSRDGWCITCVLEQRYGLTDARGLYRALREERIGPSADREPTIDGLLKGLLNDETARALTQWAC